MTSVQLHRKQGGQMRIDQEFRGGDIIVWYPMQQGRSHVPTLLIEELRQFGRLLQC